jgi:hypothetical protein
MMMSVAMLEFRRGARLRLSPALVEAQRIGSARAVLIKAEMSALGVISLQKSKIERPRKSRESDFREL